MTYDKRFDGRGFDEVRPMEAKAGVIKRAVGSGWFKIGKTEALAAVYGPRDLFPRFLKDPEKGLLRVKYNMMPFSSGTDRVRPGPSRRSKERPNSSAGKECGLPARNPEDGIRHA